MNPFQSILAATDFSADGNNAVRRAALLAHEYGARLHILHVLKADGCKPLREWFSSPTIDIDLKAAQARSALRRLAVQISGAYDVAATVAVEVGEPHETLMKASERADLVVLGQRDRNRLDGLLVRGTVDRMLRTCRRPILVVKRAVEESYQRVLVPIDFAAASDAAMRLAAAMPLDDGIHVFHAISSRREAILRDADVPDHIIRESRSIEEAGTSARIRRRVARLGLDSTRMNVSVAHGPAVRSILLQVRRLDADLIVAGKQSRSAVGGFLLGSVSRRVLVESDRDVLIIPRPRDVSTSRVASTRDPVAWTRNTTHSLSGKTS